MRGSQSNRGRGGSSGRVNKGLHYEARHGHISCDRYVPKGIEGEAVTIARLNDLIDAYQRTREHTRWVMKNLDAPAINSAETAKAMYASAMDQEMAALRDVVEGAKIVRMKP